MTLGSRIPHERRQPGRASKSRWENLGGRVNLGIYANRFWTISLPALNFDTQWEELRVIISSYIGRHCHLLCSVLKRGTSIPGKDVLF